MALAIEIKKRRSSLNMSIDKLAIKAGISKTYLWELEHDPDESKKPSAKVLLQIAIALDTTIGDLLEQPTIQINKQSITPPPSLIEFAEEMKKIEKPLSKEELYDLAATSFRGAQPTTADGWRDLYSVLKRSSLE